MPIKGGGCLCRAGGPAMPIKGGACSSLPAGRKAGHADYKVGPEGRPCRLQGGACSSLPAGRKARPCPPQNVVRWVLLEPAELISVASQDATRVTSPVTGYTASSRNTPPRSEPAKYFATADEASVRIVPGAIGLPETS